MPNERKSPGSVVADLRVAHLTRAVTRRGEIRFELHVPENDRDRDVAEELRRGLLLEMPFIPDEKTGPISVDEDDRDKSKVVIVYKPGPKRSTGEDMREFVRILQETDVPITDGVKEGIDRAFTALAALNAGHAAAEDTRRSAKKGPHL